MLLTLSSDYICLIPQIHQLLEVMVFSRLKSSKASETLLPGQISYLKKRDEYGEEDLRSVDMNDGCFDHLVLILSIATQDARVEALIVRLCQVIHITVLNHSHS